MLGDAHGDLVHEVAHLARLRDEEQPAGLLDGFEDATRVHRLERAEVYHLRVYPVLAEFRADLRAPVGHSRIADDGKVVALAADRGLAERHDVILLRHLALLAVEHLMFDEEDRVLATDARLEKPLGVVRRGGTDDEDARHVHEPRLEALRVMRGDAAPRAALGPEDHRHGGLSAEHVAELRGLVADLVHGDGHEVHVHDLGHGPVAAHGRADRGAGDGRLGDGRVADALRAELVVEPARRAVGAAVDPDVLAHDEDALIANHLLAERVANRLPVKDLCHVVSRLPGSHG